MNLKLISLLFFLNFFSLYSLDEVSIFRQSISIEKHKVFALNAASYNGLTIQAPENYSFNNLSLIVNHKDTFRLSKDEHAEINQSNLIIFENAKYYEFLSEVDANIKLIFQYVPILNISIPALQSKRGNCDMTLNIINQQTWRQGLNPPTKGREATQTHHCIIHHSASNNSQTDYTQLVRSFYVQHTQVNGWDDIAYNYLIAPNGSIYAGRDPEKAEIQQDNVLGAHFCAKNANTMGVCLIGDYQTISPSDKMIEKLSELLLWKYVKDTLNPKFEFNHPYNTGSPLGTLAGHRQGCATDCPGNYAFSKLDSLRNAIYQNFKQCLPNVSNYVTYLNYKNVIYPNPSTGLININTDFIDLKKPIQIYNAEGQLLAPSAGIETPLNNGIYMVYFTFKTGEVKVEKLVVCR